MFGKLLFKLAKSPLMGKAVGLGFQYFCELIPVKKVYCSKDVLAFWHPQPFYPKHIVLSPRKFIQNLQQMASAAFSRYFVCLWEAAQQVHEAAFEQGDSFILLANGGSNQKVQQVHFHLFTGDEMVHDDPAKEPQTGVFYQDDTLCVREHSKPDYEIHFVLTPAEALDAAGDENVQEAYFRSVLQSIDRLDAKFHFVERGYSLVCQRSSEIYHVKYPVFHIIAGKRKS